MSSKALVNSGANIMNVKVKYNIPSSPKSPYNRSLTTNASNASKTIPSSQYYKSNASKISGGPSELNDEPSAYYNYQPKYKKCIKTAGEIFEEANVIMNERVKHQHSSLPTNNSKLSVLKNCRDISLKNYLIGLLKLTRTNITNKEQMISRALKDTEYRLDIDSKNFIDFMDRQKEKQKKEEKMLVL